MDIINKIIEDILLTTDISFTFDDLKSISISTYKKQTSVVLWLLVRISGSSTPFPHHAPSCSLVGTQTSCATPSSMVLVRRRLRLHASRARQPRHISHEQRSWPGARDGKLASFVAGLRGRPGKLQLRRGPQTTRLLLRQAAVQAYLVPQLGATPDPHGRPRLVHWRAWCSGGWPRSSRGPLVQAATQASDGRSMDLWRWILSTNGFARHQRSFDCKWSSWDSTWISPKSDR